MTTSLESTVQDRLSKRFDKWDTNGNGVLEASDFVGEAVKIAGAFGKSPAEAVQLNDAFQGMFGYLAKEAGISPEGSLTREQFMDVAGKMFQSGPATFNNVLGPVATGLIALCDRNNDGVIDGDEFAAWLQAVGVPAADVADAFRKVDTAGQGHLTEAELLDAIRAYHFGQLEVELLG
ncbi:calerythrin [Streptomyces laurentii]|uniref:Calerythrin n=1 Tax=Streptomyces laurentii TaxID=39478 RepID=A0A160P5Z9_STRLU|nr:calerythrin [Streptomyces laurentii]